MCGTGVNERLSTLDLTSTLANPHCTVPFCRAPPRSGNTRKFLTLLHARIPILTQLTRRDSYLESSPLNVLPRTLQSVITTLTNNSSADTSSSSGYRCLCTYLLPMALEAYIAFPHPVQCFVQMSNAPIPPSPGPSRPRPGYGGYPPPHGNSFYGNGVPNSSRFRGDSRRVQPSYRPREPHPDHYETAYDGDKHRFGWAMNYSHPQSYDTSSGPWPRREVMAERMFEPSESWKHDHV